MSAPVVGRTYDVSGRVRLVSVDYPAPLVDIGGKSRVIDRALLTDLTWVEVEPVRTVVNVVTLADLEARLCEYETRYGVPSERMAEAFYDETADCYDETDDWRRWSMLWTAAKRLRSRLNREGEVPS